MRKTPKKIGRRSAKAAELRTYYEGPGYMGEAVADETAAEPERPDDFEPYDIVDAEDVPWATK